MKRILVPTDFSINAHNAFKFALHVADRFNASISTVHIGDPVNSYKDYAPETLLQKMESEMEKEFEKYQKEAQVLRQSAENESMTRVQINHILREGHFIPEVLDVLAQNDYDLIVMGTKGASNVSKVLFGSNTTKLIAKAPCPVLVIPDKSQYVGFPQIAYAMEMKWKKDFAIEIALDWAQRFNGNLDCFTIERNGSKNWERLEEMINSFRFEFRKHTNLKFELVDDKDFYWGIHNFMRFRTPDLLVMVYKKLGIIDKFLLDRKVRDVALGTEKPLLVLKEKA